MSVQISIKKWIRVFIIIIILIVAILYFSHTRILTSIGEFLVVDENPVLSDAVLVLNTGMEYYPRLIEAADLFRSGYVEKIIINGNRKTETLRELEKIGFRYCCPWYEERVRILELLNIPKDNVLRLRQPTSWRGFISNQR